MSLPTNKIKKIKLPNNTEYDIVPTMLQDGTTNNKLIVPTLSVDGDEIVTTRTKQTIFKYKQFYNGLGVGQNDSQGASDLFTLDSYQDSDLNLINATSSLGLKPGLTFHIPPTDTTGKITPHYNNKIDIGDTNYKFRNLYLSGYLYSGYVNVSGDATFNGQVISENQPLLVQADNFSSYTGEDWDTEFYADKIVVHNADLGESFTLNFPEKEDGSTSTIATTSDLTEIVDLTSLATSN